MMDTTGSSRHKIVVDVQSLLQTASLIIVFVGFGIREHDKLVNLEIQEQVDKMVQADLISTQKTIVDLFNSHIISSTREGQQFKELSERVHQIEIKLHMKTSDTLQPYKE